MEDQHLVDGPVGATGRRRSGCERSIASSFRRERAPLRQPTSMSAFYITHINRNMVKRLEKTPFERLSIIYRSKLLVFDFTETCHFTELIHFLWIFS